MKLVRKYEDAIKYIISTGESALLVEEIWPSRRGHLSKLDPENLHIILVGRLFDLAPARLEIWSLLLSKRRARIYGGIFNKHIIIKDDILLRLLCLGIFTE